MVVTQEWIYKQIQGVIKLAAMMMFRKGINELTLENKFEDTEVEKLRIRIIALVNNYEFNAAEDLLFDTLDPEDNKFLELALDFYNRLNEMDTDILEENDFSRTEIENGLNDIMKIYDVFLP